jgi:hypothetical protein
MVSVDKKILEHLEQQGTKASPIRISALEEMTFKHHNEKILREILRVRNEMAAAADESENRPPISLAELGQRFARPLLVAL